MTGNILKLLSDQRHLSLLRVAVETMPLGNVVLGFRRYFRTAESLAPTRLHLAKLHE